MQHTQNMKIIHKLKISQESLIFSSPEPIHTNDGPD